MSRSLSVLRRIASFSAFLPPTPNSMCRRPGVFWKGSSQFPLRMCPMNKPRNEWANLHMGIRKTFAFGLLAVLAVTAACRLDMQDQPRFKAQARNDFFPDLRSAREPVDGTVARGQLHEDTYFYTGKIGDNPGDAFPFPVTKQILERGQQRYNIFCAPCHSRVGDGKGMIPSRGFSRMPPSYHIERLQKAPAGYFFDVITNGLGIMQGYSPQIPAQDRWAIMAYIL